MPRGPSSPGTSGKERPGRWGAREAWGSRRTGEGAPLCTRPWILDLGVPPEIEQDPCLIPTRTLRTLESQSRRLYRAGWAPHWAPGAAWAAAGAWGCFLSLCVGFRVLKVKFGQRRS